MARKNPAYQLDENQIVEAKIIWSKLSPRLAYDEYRELYKVLRSHKMQLTHNQIFKIGATALRDDIEIPNWMADILDGITDALPQLEKPKEQVQTQPCVDIAILKEVCSHHGMLGNLILKQYNKAKSNGIKQVFRNKATTKE